MQLSPTLALMEQAVRKAGESLVHDFTHREALHIESKNPGDYVSEADRRSEKIIVDILRGAHPDWGILGEEGTDYKAGSEGYRFIIDPLDGTSNFLHGVANWNITIALEKDGEVIAGVTFDALRDELFYAEKGKGAFMNGQRLHVSDNPGLKKSMIALNIGYLRNDADAVNHIAKVLERAYLAEVLIQKGGGLALELAYVAAGRYDFVHCYLVEPWDLAAGIILIQEAGGTITDLNLLPLTAKKSGLLAGNPVLHSAYTTFLELN